MKEFRTELMSAVSAWPIDLKDTIFTIGSCFADTIGEHLIENKFTVWNNQFGTVYNPLSIHSLLLLALESKLPSSESYLQNEGIHLNYDFHSSFSSLNKEELKSKIQTSLIEANRFLKNANRIIITYGTAFVYRLKSNNGIVANCHKVPSVNFTKSLLTEIEIVESFKFFYLKLKSINPNCKIMLTVSPVRHLKDTLELNAVSKSILRLSCHSIVNQFSDVAYFPAYEILLDDLRDYRFYKSDRLHPTDEAIEYIGEKFVAAYFDESAKKFVNDWEEIRKDLQHKPFYAESASHQQFLKSVLIKLDKLNSLIDVSMETQNVKSQMANIKNSATSSQ
jgi:GSCFA family